MKLSSSGKKSRIVKLLTFPIIESVTSLTHLKGADGVGMFVFTGGTSLLVGCVLGKSSVKPKQQVRGPLKRKLSDKKKELVTASHNDTGLAPSKYLCSGSVV